MSAALTEALVAVALAARKAGHGGKSAIYDAACRDLRLSRATLARKLKEVSVTSPRKRRSDAGKTALTQEEAQLISAALIESMRKNGKRLYAVGDTLQALRANGMIRAEFIDIDTGEIRPLSESTIHRALRGYGLHPDQLLAPAPVTELASEHPNHVWQIDASLCVLYYLRPSADPRENGLRVMDHKKFYKNKPKNMAKIAADRVWSYEITDHTTGWVYVEYVMGAESGENLCSVLINAMQDRGGADRMHGVPRILMLDPGSAGTAGMTRNLCRALGVEMIVHAPGNARATGQVENARNLIERKFEPGLKFRPVRDLAELNALAAQWRAYFNDRAEHGRHGMTRNQAWSLIRPEQLILAPSVEVCRELAVAAPDPRTVTPKLRVSFGGREYDVSGVPGVMVGERLMITRNPWRDDAAQAVLVGEDGHETYHVIPAVEKTEWNYSTTAATIGKDFKRHADTPAQTALKAIEQLVTGTDSSEAAAAARKAKELPFGGRYDPYKHIREAEYPAYLPRRGTAHDLTPPEVVTPPLSHVEAALKIRAAIGDAWTAERYQWLAQRYPDGVPEAALESIIQDLSGARADARVPLRAVL